MLSAIRNWSAYSKLFVALCVIFNLSVTSRIEAQERLLGKGLPPSQEYLPNPPPVEPGTIPGEPSPILDKPTLFPPEAGALPTPPTDSPLRQPPQLAPTESATTTQRDNVGANSDTYKPVSNSFSSGAASAFGFDLHDRGAPRPSVAGSQAASERDRILARAARQATLQNYNIKLGPIPLRFAAGLDFEFSDNINNSKNNKLADLVIIPHLDVYGSVRLSRFNNFTLELSLGYLKDINRSDQDRALTSASLGLDSNSEISFDIKIGHFLINLHERPQIPRQHADLLNQREAIEFGQFTNTVGVAVLWDVNSRLSFNLRYDHFNSIAISSRLDSLDQSAEQVSLSTSFRLTGALLVGFQASGSVVTYDQAFLNDVTTYSFGPTLELRISPFLSLQGAVGYQIGTFASGGGVRDESSLDSWYGNLTILNKLNTRISQTLSFGHESQIGIASNFTEIDYIRHRVDWSVIKDVSLGTYCAFENGQESGGFLSQHFQLFEAGIFANYSLTRKLNLTIFYRFIRRNASGSGLAFSGDTLGYSENRLDLNLRYAF